MPYDIHLLIDRQETIPALTELFISEWTPWYGPGGEGDALADLTACLNRKDLPIALVAISKDGEVLGSAALKPESLGAEFGFSPWLAALVIDPSHRGKGIASALIARIEELAASLVIREIYVSTRSANSIIERRGWQKLNETTLSLDGPVAIYRKVLD